MRKKLELTITDVSALRQNLPAFTGRFETSLLLDGNNYGNTDDRPLKYHTYDILAAVGALSVCRAEAGQAFESLKSYLDSISDWAFGHFAYDLKNETEDLISQHPNNTGFPELFFFQPAWLFMLRGEELTIEYPEDLRETDALEVLDELMDSNTNGRPRVPVKVAMHGGERRGFEEENIGRPRVPVEAAMHEEERRGVQGMTKEDYLEKVNKIIAHIQAGDIYEANFCQEFRGIAEDLDTAALFAKLNAISPNPFAAYYRLSGCSMLCASPERFLKKEGSRVISQPIKGTIRRGHDSTSDEANHQTLAQSEKDRSENVMIVDLVRNDLSRTAAPQTVKVEELCGIYAFPQVFQSISTVVSEVSPGTHPVDIIKNAFPMGSMTGCPKIRATQLIDEYETFRRNLFSGAVGYFSPAGDFDFNVVIRSIFHNANTGYFSYATGGAITILSKPEEEYEECILKAEAILQVLST